MRDRRASPSEEGLLQDAAAAYAFTAARYRADRIVVWGFSLGTGVAVAIAADHPVGRLILEAPYTSTVDVAASHVPDRAGAPVDARPVPFRPRASRGVTVPLLIMHGDADPAINISFGERLFALAHEPKQFVRFPDGGHENLDNFGAIETARHFIGALKG